MPQTYAPSRPRKTVALKGTAARLAAYLDYESLLTVAYAQAALSRAGSPRVPSSGLIRRALAVYLRHLGGADMAQEVREVSRACRASTGIKTDEAYMEATKRLEEADKSQPLPAFNIIRVGAAVAAEDAAMVARLDAFMAEQFPDTDTTSTGGRA